MTSSSIIVMPDMSAQPPVSAPPSDYDSSSASVKDTDEEDDMSDASSVSMVSFSGSDDEDAGLWADSRREVRAEPASPPMEYVLLYDDNTSDED
jgi:hypothetical protein